MGDLNIKGPSGKMHPIMQRDHLPIPLLLLLFPFRRYKMIGCVRSKTVKAGVIYCPGIGLNYLGTGRVLLVKFASGGKIAKVIIIRKLSRGSIDTHTP